MRTLTQSFTTCGALALLVVAACGGAAKVQSGLGDKDPPPPTGTEGAGGKVPDRVISKDAAADYAAAAEYFTKQEAAGWTKSSCEEAADKFGSVADDHKTIIEARYMQGVSLHRCGLLEGAEQAYRQVTAVNPNHAPSISNLGDLYFAAGKRDAARAQWEQAVKVYPKVVAARVNLASMMIEELRVTKDPAKWTEIEKAARDHLSNSLAVDGDNVEAYTAYALVYMEGRQKNKNRLDLAKVLLDEGSKPERGGEKFAPLRNAYGLYHMARGNLNAALAAFQDAVKLDGKFVEARMNAGLIKLNVREFGDAKALFAAVIELQPTNYDAHIGLGVALRGLEDFKAAEAQYQKARQVDGKRGEAVFNLGVLSKEFMPKTSPDMKVTQGHYKAAMGYFREFVAMAGISDEDKAEATNNIKDCEKMIANLDEFIKMSAEGGGG